MPELPEVETMVRYLRERAVDGKITAVRIKRETRKGYLPNDERTALVGQTLHTLFRRGKYMTFHLNGGIMVCHNAMSGYWDLQHDPWTFDYVEGERKATDSDVRVEIDVLCNHEHKTLRFHDTRLFGSLRFYPGVRFIHEIPCLFDLGPEALTTENVDQTISKGMDRWSMKDMPMLNPNWEIKHALMDQTAVAGFGNIYAAEACHLALINPFRKTKDLTIDELRRVFESGQNVLDSALRRKLDYSALWCYRQKNCKICLGPIEKKDLRGRSTYFCPRCQL